jgi:hypothetical protein
MAKKSLAAAAAGFLVVVGLAGQVPAYAAPGPGTWTKITTPSGARTTILSKWGEEGQMKVKGQASLDVVSVNVYCLRGSGSDVDATTVATSVPVSTGAFHTTVPVPGGVTEPRCRLRALPSGVNPSTAYLASYAGPQMNFDSWQYFSSQDTFQLLASTGNGSLESDGSGVCGATFLGTLLPDGSVPGGSSGCLHALGAPALGASRSTVRVDGHEAYTTSAALSYGLTPTHLASTSFHLRRGGGLRWTELMPVDRCASGDAFPPSAGSCPTLVSSGVEIRQVSTYLAGGHQVRTRTEFRSVDGKRHALRLGYLNTVSGVGPGSVGYRFPGQKRYRRSSLGEHVKHLGKSSGTMLARSDVFGEEGDPAVSTWAITWSRRPTAITFSPTDASTATLTYRLTVPKGGSVHLGFTDSDGTLTSQAVALGKKGKADMMPTPRITAPAAGAVVMGTKTKVTGVVRAGANGLPTSVTVNGHVAKLKMSKGGSRATYQVTFTEALGKHTIVAVAKDAAGNHRSTTVKVRNK